MTGKPKNRPRQISLPAPQTTPRNLEAIQADYQQTALQAGQSQYQVFVHSEDLKSLNQKLLNLNREAAERNRLDQEAKNKEETPSEPTT